MYAGNDGATGLMGTVELGEAFDRAAAFFNEWNSVHGWYAAVVYVGLGNYEIAVDRDGDMIATFDNLDEFEAFESRVESGEYAEATA
jgi:hypothetical protein